MFKKWRPGDLLEGRFEIARLLGSGGMATVYLARQRGLDRYVALKRLEILGREEMPNDPLVVERFLREARVSASFNRTRESPCMSAFSEERTTGVEPATFGLGSRRSTN